MPENLEPDEKNPATPEGDTGRDGARETTDTGTRGISWSYTHGHSTSSQSHGITHTVTVVKGIHQQRPDSKP
jgi:hypothetical protein